MKITKTIKNMVLAGSIITGANSVQAKNLNNMDYVSIKFPDGYRTTKASFSEKKGLEGYLNEFIPKGSRLDALIEVKKPNGVVIRIPPKGNNYVWQDRKRLNYGIDKYVINNNVSDEVTYIIKNDKNWREFSKKSKNPIAPSFKKRNIPEMKIINLEVQEIKPVSNNNISDKEKFKQKLEYRFDLNTNGKIDDLKLIKSNNEFFIKSNEGYINKLDKARYEVLKNLRFSQDSPRKASKGYIMTLGNQGEDVVKFLYETNKYSNDKYCETKKKCYDIKFKTLEGLVEAIDKTANLSERADYINNKFFEAYDSGKINQKYLNKKSEIYSSTFGKNVPLSIVALNFALGSALYTTITHDFLPTKEANKALSRARGALNANNLVLFQRNGINYKNVAKAYNNVKNMYKAQLKASENKIVKRNF